MEPEVRIVLDILYSVRLQEETRKLKCISPLEGDKADTVN